MMRYIAFGVLILMLLNALMPSAFTLKILPFMPFWLDPFLGISIMPTLLGLACIAAFIVSQLTGWLAFRNGNYGFSILWATVPVIVTKLVAIYVAGV